MSRRKSNERKAKNDFYIITNGAQTESNYFDSIKAKKSIYSVRIVFSNRDPIGMIEDAKEVLPKANQVWCVFDIDYTHRDNRLVPALKEARKFGIKIAYSNKAFEVWLISHFEQFKAKRSLSEYANILTKHLYALGCREKYDKVDKKLLKSYFIPRYKDAVINAKIVYQKYDKEFNESGHKADLPPIWEWDASTTVYKLIEALQLRE